MDIKAKNASTMDEMKVNVRIRLSALWIAIMFLNTYADILGFYTPGTIEQLVTGKIGSVQINESFLVVMAVWMAIPSLMIFLSLVVKASVNRWMNVIAGVLSMFALVATFFAGEITLRYIFQAIVEGSLLGAVAWQAWSWPKQESVEGEH